MRRSILDSVREQLLSGSLCGLTMEGIARQAGVGKVTVYRWWPSVAEVALEALLEDVGQLCPVPNTGDFAADLRVFLNGVFTIIETRTGTLLRCLMVEAQKNPAFRERFREQFIRSRQESLLGLLRSRKADPKLHALLVDMIFGTLWYRLLVGHARLDAALADELCHVAVILLCDKTTTERRRLP